MKIAYIIPGSGGSFYCENCLRDSSLADALVVAGFDVVQVPMYLPLFRDSGGKRGDAPIFYGAVRLFVRERFRMFRRMPRFLERILDSRPALRLAARLAGSTSAQGLESMTVSMLSGESGNEADELEKLARWLRDFIKPDLVHLSNALLLGLAKRLKQTLGVPIVCSLQDEHTWIEPMDGSFRAQVWALLKEKSAHVARFVAVSDYYKNEMMKKLMLETSRIEVIPLGVDPARYSCRAAPPEQPVIGFLSRLEASSGLEELVEAVRLLVFEHGLDDVRLVAYGGMTGDDLPYVRKIKKLIRRLGLGDRVELVASYDRKRRFDFLHGLSVLCVPRKTPEAFGMFLLEALASGVPVVMPDLGAFPQVVGMTGGGLIVPPGDVCTLAEHLFLLLSNRARIHELALRGCENVRKHYSLARVAALTGALYQRLGKRD